MDFLSNLKLGPVAFKFCAIKIGKSVFFLNEQGFRIKLTLNHKKSEQSLTLCIDLYFYSDYLHKNENVNIITFLFLVRFS